jgi:hypothetical protein
MGMQKEQFEKLVEPLGYFKRRWTGPEAGPDAYQDEVFILFEKPKACPDCLTATVGRNVTYEKKVSYNGKWRTKCRHCKEVWENIRL